MPIRKWTWTGLNKLSKEFCVVLAGFLMSIKFYANVWDIWMRTFGFNWVCVCVSNLVLTNGCFGFNLNTLENIL